MINIAAGSPYDSAALAHPPLVDAVVLPSLRDADAKPGPAASWIVVGTGYVLRAPRGAVVRTGRDREMLNAVSPWALSHNHMLRVFAQVAVHDIIAAFHLHGGGGGEGASATDAPAYAALYSMLRRNAEMVKVRTACGPLFGKDIVADATPRALLGGALGGVGGGGGDRHDDVGEERGPDAVGFEGAPASALDRVEAFLQLSRRELRAERDALEKTLWVRTHGLIVRRAISCF